MGESMSSRFRLFALLAYLTLQPSSPAAGAPPEGVDFVTQIQPLLKQRCLECHGAEKRKGGLRLDNRADAMKGGDSGDHVIVPGKSAESELIRRIVSRDEKEYMPPKGARLSAEQIGLLRRWMDAGADWPADAAAPIVPERTVTAEQRAYWAFQPVRKPALPAVKRAAWVATPIDAFILAKLESEGLEPAPPASKTDLIRRVAFDLTGLPPTPREIDAFVGDDGPDAYGRMVEQYLASPRYGERWGQHWLDVVRYAESEGFEYDTPVGSLWKYRDYVIKSFNDDKPYDQFILQQIAGDELSASDPENLVAAGLHRLGAVRRNKGNQDVASSRNEVLTDRTDIVGAAFLGLTIGCARCHDHKFDPILQKDYYRLQAFMAATDQNDIPLVSSKEAEEWKVKTEQITKQINQLNRQMKTAAEEDKHRLAAELETLEDTLPPPLPGISTISNVAEPTPIAVLRRGEWTKKGDPVGMRFPTVLVNENEPERPLQTVSPRTLLARWLTDPKHPLTPRVMMNRLWQNHFGRGIVKTPNDFGINGDRPSHPEVLDYLAAAFLESGWRIKPLHRMILHSSTYRQSWSSPRTADAMAKDPDNRWLWRFERRRLSAEEIRDAQLAASGKLNLKMGGESVFLPVDPDLVAQLYKPTQWAVTRDKEEHYRRSIYLVAKRNLRLPSMEVFDQPTLVASCGRRETSTHAPQALELLNGRISNELAGSFAERLEKEAGADPAARVELAFRLAAGRPPTPKEQSLAVAFLAQQPLKEFALALFNLNGFLYAN
jgi:mono/diheme cytochrome c family protein